MNSTSDFISFDELKAGLRFLLFLDETTSGLDRVQLIKHMRESGISQNQVYKTIKLYKDLDLIKENLITKGNVKSVYTRLTLKGDMVAQLVQQIKQTLETS